MSCKDCKWKLVLLRLLQGLERGEDAETLLTVAERMLKKTKGSPELADN